MEKIYLALARQKPIKRGIFWPKKTELQKYLGARRCTQEENPWDFSKTGEVVCCLTQ